MLESLLEALKLSPNNIPLKHQIVKLYMQSGGYQEAEKHLVEMIKVEPQNITFKFELAQCFYQQQKISATEILLEELIENSNDIRFLELLCYCHLKQENISEAQHAYQRILEVNPKFRNTDFDEKLRVNSVGDADAIVDEDGISFYKKPTTNFKDIGGMERIKNEISLKIIKPLAHKELYKAYGKKIGGGILLYGPPGCGKTHIARATAGEISANFINVGINDILDMWIGNSEKNLHEIFETARRNTPCVIFIDEIDALGANRNDVGKTTGRTVINQFLAELDGLEANNDGILVIGATNAPWYLDPAFRRPGRFDRIIFVSPPDIEAKASIFTIQLRDKPTENIDYMALAKHAKDFSGADIKAAIDIAIENKLESAFIDGVPKPITTKDLIKAIKKMKASTREWFGSAKNYALYSNDSGLYDDILDYLNIKK